MHLRMYWLCACCSVSSCVLRCGVTCRSLRLYICMYICIHMYTYIYIYIYVYVCVHIHTFAYIYIYLCTNCACCSVSSCVLQRIAAWCTLSVVSRFIESQWVYCSASSCVLHCVAVCCSVLQCCVPCRSSRLVWRSLPVLQCFFVGALQCDVPWLSSRIFWILVTVLQYIFLCVAVCCGVVYLVCRRDFYEGRWPACGTRDRTDSLPKMLTSQLYSQFIQQISHRADISEFLPLLRSCEGPAVAGRTPRIIYGELVRFGWLIECVISWQTDSPCSVRVCVCVCVCERALLRLAAHLWKMTCRVSLSGVRWLRELSSCTDFQFVSVCVCM